MCWYQSFCKFKYIIFVSYIFIYYLATPYTTLCHIIFYCIILHYIALRYIISYYISSEYTHYPWYIRQYSFQSSRIKMFFLQYVFHLADIQKLKRVYGWISAKWKEILSWRSQKFSSFFSFEQSTFTYWKYLIMDKTWMVGLFSGSTCNNRETASRSGRGIRCSIISTCSLSCGKRRKQMIEYVTLKY